MIAPPQHCDECGFEASSVGPEEAANAIRSIGPAFRDALAPVDDQAVRRRPDASTWSALEYAAHMRDVIMLWGWGLNAVIKDDRPVIPVPEQSELDDVSSAYATLDPPTVADELAANAERMAAKADAVGEDGWERAGDFGGDDITALDILRKVNHEGHHHLLDVGRVLRTVRSQRASQ